MGTEAAADELQARLVREGEYFAKRLSETVQAAFGEQVPPFVARTAPESSRLTVHQDPRTGIKLTVGGVERLRLTVEMWCVWDHAQAFLAVEKSQTSVEAVAASAEPLFRYEYLRSPQGHQASAHVHVHGHRDATSYLMALCGEGSHRSKKRRRAAEDNARVPQLSDLHLPLGGPRFRPCLEDVLEMLIDEFGVDVQRDAREALAAGRERWRIDQLAACVRDSPETATDVLRQLGYEVEPPSDGHRENRDGKLRQL